MYNCMLKMINKIIFILRNKIPILILTDNRVQYNINSLGYLMHTFITINFKLKHNKSKTTVYIVLYDNYR